MRNFATRQAVSDRLDPVFITSDVYRRPAYGSNHPLGIARVETVVDLCRSLGWLGDHVRESEAASFGQLTEFHCADYVEALRRADAVRTVTTEQRRRFNIGTLENPVFQGVYERAATAVGGSILAAEQALEGRLAYHPAGGTHHAKAGQASGFCYFNDPVFAIRTFLRHGVRRVAYVDLDAHHGDGVEEAFAADCRVFTISIHEAGRWPGTGALGDRRHGRARNLPVPEGINDTEFAYLIDEAVLPLLAGVQPEALVITAGADALKGDPLSRMALSNGALWGAVQRLASACSRTVVLGGGGYNPWTLSRFWAGLWGLLAGEDIPETLPGDVRSILSGLSCDLVEADEIDPAWLSSLQDGPNPGLLRPEFAAIRDAVLAA